MAEGARVVVASKGGLFQMSDGPDTELTADRLAVARDSEFLGPFLTAVDIVKEERIRQIQKWGHQTHGQLFWLGVLTEEVGEVAKETITPNSPEQHARYLAEVAQVAAVAMAILEQHFREQACGVKEISK